MLCVPTSEVNFKIGAGLIEGGTSAEELRDCIAEALEDIEDGEGGYCQEDTGFTNNDLCWEALADAEAACGGPEVDIRVASFEELESGEGEPVK
jgi:hypothetical protein